jgi:hypothetical protein
MFLNGDVPSISCGMYVWVSGCRNQQIFGQLKIDPFGGCPKICGQAAVVYGNLSQDTFFEFAFGKGRFQDFNVGIVPAGMNDAEPLVREKEAMSIHFSAISFRRVSLNSSSVGFFFFFLCQTVFIALLVEFFLDIFELVEYGV